MDNVFLNLLAPFIVQVFGAQLPYVDYSIGNEAESEAWESANGLPNPKDLPAVAKVFAQQPRSNPARYHIVVFTHGATIAVCFGSPNDVKTYAANALKDEKIFERCWRRLCGWINRCFGGWNVVG